TPAPIIGVVSPSASASDATSEVTSTSPTSPLMVQRMGRLGGGGELGFVRLAQTYREPNGGSVQTGGAPRRAFSTAGAMRRSVVSCPYPATNMTDSGRRRSSTAQGTAIAGRSARFASGVNAPSARNMSNSLSP